MEGLRFKHKEITLTANAETQLPVDITSLTPEQISKWLISIDGKYFCAAPKAGWYTLCPADMNLTSIVNVTRWSRIQRRTATNAVHTSFGWAQVVNNHANIPHATATCWLNAGDIMSVAIFITSALSIKTLDGSEFIYLGNDSGDY